MQTLRSPFSLILRRARLRTMDAKSGASALAIRHGTIVAVGGDAEIAAVAQPNTPVIDLGHRVVLPGFTDAHVHWAGYALIRRQLQLAAHESLAGVLQQVAARAGELPAGSWILGRGWDHSRWGRWPAAADLDAVAAHHPVALTRKDGHVVWLNSRALVAAGIDTTTPDPPGGEIARSEGRPTGILKENAVALLHQALPEADPAERQAAIIDAWPDAWSHGLTSLHDMGLRHHSLFLDLAALRDTGELGLRIVWYFPIDELDQAIGLGLRSGLGDPWLRVGGLKLFLDGTLGSQTAEMLAPYEQRPGDRGLAVLTDEAFEEALRRAAEAGLATAVHAIGDAANRRALDGFERIAALELPRARGLRQRIEHAQLLAPEDIDRFARQQVVASMQPIHALADHDLADRWWGRRARTAYAWHSLGEAGARLAFGSDAPVETLDVFAGIHAAVTRQTPAGEPRDGWWPEQRIAVAQAIEAYTLGAAWATGQEDVQGSLTVGKYADLIVLDRDPFTIPASELWQVRVLATMIGGQWVWQAQGIELGGPWSGL
jgi:hypothetical protein